MIGKNEEGESDKAERMKIITEKKILLEENAAKIRAQVSNCFDDLIHCMKSREKQLLRQIEAVHNQQLSIIQSNWELICSQPSITVNLNEMVNLEDSISKFGQIELPDKEGLIVKNIDPYKVQEYEDISKDHVSFDKSINTQQNDKNIIIKLSNLQYTKEPLSQFNKLRLSNETKIANSNSFVKNTVDANLVTKNDISDLRLPHESCQMDNNNCSLLCSPSQDNTLQISYSTSQADDNVANSSLCSSTNIEADYSKVIFTSPCLKGSPGLNKQEDKFQIDSINNLKQNKDNFIDVNIKVNNVNIEKQLADEHPKQIQQWLQQILTESETEPSIQEIEQFAEITKFHYSESQLEA